MCTAAGMHSTSMRACVFSRLGAIESISSMKMMAGAFFSASSNAFLRLLSLSPASFDIISGPLIRKKNAPVSLATARAISVLPAGSSRDQGHSRQDMSVQPATSNQIAYSKLLHGLCCMHHCSIGHLDSSLQPR